MPIRFILHSTRLFTKFSRNVINFPTFFSCKPFYVFYSVTFADHLLVSVLLQIKGIPRFWVIFSVFERVIFLIYARQRENFTKGLCLLIATGESNPTPKEIRGVFRKSFPHVKDVGKEYNFFYAKMVK